MHTTEAKSNFDQSSTFATLVANDLESVLARYTSHDFKVDSATRLRLHERENRGSLTADPMGVGPREIIQKVRDAKARLVRPALPEEIISGLRKWEGRVVEVGDGIVTAELTPTIGDGARVFADFDIEQVAEEGDPDFAVGDVVYLTVRTVIDRLRGKRTTAMLKRGRFGAWSEAELTEAADEARELAEILGRVSD